MQQPAQRFSSAHWTTLIPTPPPPLRTPGHVAEYVTLVGDHAIPEQGPHRLPAGVVEQSHDAFRESEGGDRLRLREGGRPVVVRPVPQPTRRLEVAAGLFD